jgi:transposase
MLKYQAYKFSFEVNIMAYSLDLRQRVINYIQSNGSKISASKIFKINEKTVRNWVLLYKETGSVNPRQHRGGKRSSIDSEKFKSYVDVNPDKTLKEIGAHFGLSYEGAAYNLRKHGYVHKKNSVVQGKK